MKASFVQDKSYGAATVLQQAFAWMFGGLLATAATAMVAASSDPFQQLLHGTPMLFMGLMLAEIVLVVALSAGLTRLSPAAAVALYMGYAVLNGVTLSSLFLVYTGETIGAAFMSASMLFGLMATVGYVTKIDLSAIGSLALMALVGLIIASVVNLFLHSSGLSYLLSYGAILIFTALTAYDTQRIKEMSRTMSGTNLGIYGALRLYLDFINIFLSLLRIMGRQRS